MLPSGNVICIIIFLPYKLLEKSIKKYYKMKGCFEKIPTPNRFASTVMRQMFFNATGIGLNNNLIVLNNLQK
ncbi:MAG: hypothetical protein B6I22_01510 [Desulfobacteraceae bacterium 4572_123]|nr:MAG: hypothetical protein B6I22_01510 [Desulfobacteraceae bacterium 4572_123]